MQPDEKDLAYLWDMQNAANDILVFTKGIRFEEFSRTKIIRFAVERQLLVIGEAANHISEVFQEAHQDIPWRQIIGQRNVLAHEYGEIKADRVWSTATVNIPLLVKTLNRLLNSN
ncbi:MAG TPA: DUF86 domain-containing protein [Longilinea sp.]|nr:DUF86 domain-containing protein [Longilinea sp.]